VGAVNEERLPEAERKSVRKPAMAGVIDLTDDDLDDDTKPPNVDKKRKASQITKVFDGSSFVENKKTKISDVPTADTSRYNQPIKRQETRKERPENLPEPEWTSKQTSTTKSRAVNILQDSNVTFGKVCYISICRLV
jgi:hypothetical protein